MKLIIDIPTEEYNDIVLQDVYRLKELGEHIRNGVLVEDATCEDCISREAVRRILANQRDELVKLHTVNPKDNPKADAMAYGVNWSLNTLMELPSVTPSYNSIKIELEPCKDCISRQAVLDKKELVELEDGQSFYCINPEDVETLPSVKPQRPSGEAEIWERIKEYVMSDGFMDDYPEDVIAEIWMMRKELEDLKND